MLRVLFFVGGNMMRCVMSGWGRDGLLIILILMLIL